MKKILLLLVLISINYLLADYEWQWSEHGLDKLTFYNIDCADSLNCVAVGGNSSFAMIYRTTDGGWSWNKIHDEYYDSDVDTVDYPDPQMAFDIAYPHKDTIYISYEDTKIKKTTDMCQTFDTVQLKDAGFLRNIYMADSYNGITGYFKYVWVTNDGWKSWKEIEIPLNKKGKSTGDIWMHDKNNFGFIWNDADLFFYYTLTIDGGNNWHTFKFPKLIEKKQANCRNIYFVNDSLGYIVGNIKRNIGDTKKDIIFKTTNGGYSWELIYNEEYEKKENNWNWGLQNVAFKDSLNGVAVGQFGKILYTSDGGSSWHQDSLVYPGTNSPVNLGAPTMSVTFAGDNPLVTTFAAGIWQGKWKPTGIRNNKTKNNTILTYPNPCGSYIYYEFPPALHSRKAVLKVYDAAGNLVGTENLTIQSGRLKYIHEIKTSGTYFWQIEAGGEVFNGKFVRE